jgi:hypothetical protein
MNIIQKSAFYIVPALISISPAICQAEDVSLIVNAKVPNYFFVEAAAGGSLSDPISLDYNAADDTFATGQKKLAFITSNVNNGVKMQLKNNAQLTAPGVARPINLRVRMNNNTTTTDWIAATGEESSFDANQMGWGTSVQGRSADITFEVEAVPGQTHPQEGDYSNSLQLSFVQKS